MTLGFEELIKSKSYISGLGVRVREDVFFYLSSNSSFI